MKRRERRAINLLQAFGDLIVDLLHLRPNLPVRAIFQGDRPGDPAPTSSTAQPDRPSDAVRSATTGILFIFMAG